jgi:hypothetical protein
MTKRLCQLGPWRKRFLTWVFRAQVISLGVHVVHEVFPAAMLLMEVMPSLLARRSFPRPATERCLEPGFRDSPHPSAVALVFIRVGCPLTCHMAVSTSLRLFAIINLCLSVNISVESLPGCVVANGSSHLRACQKHSASKYATTVHGGARWATCTGSLSKYVSALLSINV